MICMNYISLKSLFIIVRFTHITSFLSQEWSPPTINELEDWKHLSCFLEVDFEYPEDLHDLHNFYPLAPGRIKIKNVEKLIPNLNNKTNYVYIMKI